MYWCMCHSDQCEFGSHRVQLYLDPALIVRSRASVTTPRDLSFDAGPGGGALGLGGLYTLYLCLAVI